jgi:hypothetical protein
MQLLYALSAPPEWVPSQKAAFGEVALDSPEATIPVTGKRTPFGFTASSMSFISFSGN